MSFFDLVVIIILCLIKMQLSANSKPFLHCIAMNTQLTEIMRLITNLIRTGTITEVDRFN